MPLREDIYKILTELDRRRAEELDHTIQAETPGTPAYASAAIADLFPSPNAFLATTQIPFLSDAAGLAADVEMYRERPESRNWLNYGLSGLGMLPFVPGVVGMMRKAPYDDALKAAQEHAALPKSKGGLGLPPDNTAADRARAMGAREVYHGTNADVASVDPRFFGKKTGNPNAMLGFYTTPNFEEASRYAKDWGTSGGNVMPLMAMPKSTFDMPYVEHSELAMLPYRMMQKDPLFDPNAVVSWSDTKAARDAAERLAKYEDRAKKEVKKKRKDLQRKGFDSVLVNDGSDYEELVALDPSILRSRFAAFDPFRRNEADLLAQYALPLGLGSLLAFPFLSEEQQTY